jgi:hypothetical protein
MEDVAVASVLASLEDVIASLLALDVAFGGP